MKLAVAIIAVAVSILQGVASYATKPTSGRESATIEVSGLSATRLRVDFPRIGTIYQLQVANAGQQFRTVSQIALTKSDLSVSGHYLGSASGMFRSAFFKLVPGSNSIRVMVNGSQKGAIKRLTTPKAGSPSPKPTTPSATQVPKPTTAPTPSTAVDRIAPSVVTGSSSLPGGSLAPGGVFVLSFTAVDETRCCGPIALTLHSLLGDQVTSGVVSTTALSSTRVAVKATITLPANTATGTYEVRANLTDSNGNQSRHSLGNISVIAQTTQTDMLNPVIDPSSGSVLPAQVEPGNSVVASYRITDDFGCCGYHQAWLYGPTGATILQVAPQRVSGTAVDAIYSATFSVPNGAAIGSYVVKAQATDLTGKYTHLQTIATLTVTAQTAPPTVDTALPVLVPGSAVVTPSSIQPGNPLSVSYRVTDDFGCCSSARAYLYDSAGASVTFVEAARSAGTNLDGTYSATINIPAGTAPGTYTVKGQAIDNAGKYTHLVVLATITVTAQTAPPTVDTANPVIDPASGVLSNSSIAPGQSFTLSYRITDDVGCCNPHNAFLYAPNGSTIASASAQRISGTVTDGIYQATFTLPISAGAGTYTLKSQVTDLTGKYSHLQLLASFTIP